jgi:hypothetical protein
MPERTLLNLHVYVYTRPHTITTKYRKAVASILGPAARSPDPLTDVEKNLHFFSIPMIRPQISAGQRLNPFSHRQDSQDLIEQFEMFIWVVSSNTGAGWLGLLYSARLLLDVANSGCQLGFRIEGIAYQLHMSERSC